MKTKFKMHSDPGHGWLAVSANHIFELDLQDKISPYSYQKGKTIYLEEDMDASTFLKAYEERYKVKPEIVCLSPKNKNHPIRSYNPYKR